MRTLTRLLTFLDGTLQSTDNQPTPMAGQAYTDSAIRHLAASKSGKYVAAAEFESTVSIWNLETQTKESQFETVLDFGKRLAIDESGTRFIAGASYHVHRVACYDTKTGSLVWQRRDIRNVADIAILPSQNEVACGFGKNRVRILSIVDGSTLEEFTGYQQLYRSPYEPVQLVEKKFLFIETLDGTVITKIKRTSFAVLAVTFGHDAVTVSESGGPVRCFSTKSGELLWSYQSAEGSHSLVLGYHAELRRFLAVEWPFRNGGPKTLILFGRDGIPEQKFVVGSSIVEEFCLSGSRLLSSSGWLIDTTTAKLAGHFDFPLKEYPAK